VVLVRQVHAEIQQVHHCWPRRLLYGGTAGLLGSALIDALHLGLSNWGTVQVASVESAEKNEEEGLHGVHRQLRRNEHPKTKDGRKKFSGKRKNI
jgi:hypothetical protein